MVSMRLCPLHQHQPPAALLAVALFTLLVLATQARPHSGAAEEVDGSARGAAEADAWTLQVEDLMQNDEQEVRGQEADH